VTILIKKIKISINEPNAITGFSQDWMTHKAAALWVYLFSVLVDSFVLRNPPLRQAAKTLP